MRTIAQISDLHFGRHDRRVADDLLISIGEDRPDLVVATGDFTQRARLREFQEAEDFLRHISPAKLLVPGNHDVPLYNLFSRFHAPLERYSRYIAPNGVPNALYRDAEIAVLGLNTTRRLMNKRGRISFEQVEQVRGAFCGLPAPVFKALVTHHPLAAPAGQRFKLALRAPSAVMELARMDVHLLLSGHRHRALSGHIAAELSAQGAILVLHAGTAISTRTRGGEANSYNLIRIDGLRISIDVKEWSPGVGFRTTNTALFVLRDGAWSMA